MLGIIRKIKDLFGKLSYILTKQQKMLGLLVILTALLSAAFETIGVSVIVPLVNVLIEPNSLLSDPRAGIVFRTLGVETEKQVVLTVILGVIVIYIIKNVFLTFSTWIGLKYSYKIQRECSVQMFSSYLKRGYTFFLEHNVNELLQGASGDVAALNGIVSALIGILTQGTIILFIFVYMILSDWQISLGVILSAALCLLIIMLVYKRKMQEAGVGIRSNAIYVNKTILEAFNGIKEVLVMRKQDYYVDEYNSWVTKKQKYQIGLGMGGATPAYIIEAVCITGIMSVLCVKTLNQRDAAGFVATLAAFAVGAFRIMPGLGKISSSINSTASYIPNLNAIYENIKEAKKLEGEDSDREKENPIAMDDVSIGKNFESIAMKNLRFAYDEKQLGYVLDGINIDISRGESVAVIGETGAGKSTLADIVLGLLNPSEGMISIDGINIRNIPDKWAEMIGFVPQSIYLSDCSIKENVAFGVRRDEIDEELVRESLREANILSFIDTLPDGIDNVVGDRGVRLSGGQCQRIGIARALYRKPTILVLDEATSALDNETERVVMETIEQLHGRMTMIIIAHRLTTIEKCDKIYEIKNGKAYERTYADL